MFHNFNINILPCVLSPLYGVLLSQCIIVSLPAMHMYRCVNYHFLSFECNELDAHVICCSGCHTRDHIRMKNPLVHVLSGKHNMLLSVSVSKNCWDDVSNGLLWLLMHGQIRRAPLQCTAVTPYEQAARS